MRNENETRLAMDKYADTIRRICFVYLKKYSDVEDAFQNIFLKYVLYERTFESDSHEKAWLIRVTINECKDTLKSFFRSKVHSLQDHQLPSVSQEHSEILDAVLQLDKNYKIVIYLFYYEGYSAVEIADILHKKENTVYTWLSRGRQQLKERLRGDFLEQ